MQRALGNGRMHWRKCAASNFYAIEENAPWIWSWRTDRNSTRTRLPLERAGAIMKKLKIFLTYISSNRVWIITLACLDVFFIFLAWLANPDYFINYVALIIFVSLPHLLSRLLYQSENATRQTLFFGVFYWSQTIPTNTYCVKLFPQYYALISVNWGSIWGRSRNISTNRKLQLQIINTTLKIGYMKSKSRYPLWPCYWTIEKMKCPLWFIPVCCMYATIPDRI